MLDHDNLEEFADPVNYDRGYGDRDEEPPTAASPSIISVCRKRT